MQYFLFYASPASSNPFNVPRGFSVTSEILPPFGEMFLLHTSNSSLGCSPQFCNRQPMTSIARPSDVEYPYLGGFSKVTDYFTSHFWGVKSGGHADSLLCNQQSNFVSLSRGTIVMLWCELKIADTLLAKNLWNNDEEDLNHSRTISKSVQTNKICCFI